MVESFRSFLLAPAAGGGRGIGHLARCIALADELGGACALYAGGLDAASMRFLQKKISEMPAGSTPQVRETLDDTDCFHIVLLDRWKTTKAEHDFFSRFGTVICLDEGGEARDLAAYIIDALPAPPGHSPPNRASLGFLGLNRGGPQKVISGHSRVLVTFGGEDRADLSGAFLEGAIRSHLIPISSLTILEGPLFRRRIWPEGVKILRDVTNIGKIVESFDLVITHFGTTALETLARGVPVVLLNPSRHHYILGTKLGIPQIGIGKPDMHELSRLMQSPSILVQTVKRFSSQLDEAGGERLASVLRSIPAGTGRKCPICHSDGNSSAGRFAKRTYYRCAKCRIIYLDRFTENEKLYEKPYFFEEYKNQYGKTYLEDFETIKTTGKQRIKYIRGLLGTTANTIVDVGCAYGPFLDALREAGYKPFGIDISPDAVKYVQDLGIPAIVGAFQTMERDKLPKQPISGVTFWYVVEHFQDLDLCLKKASAFLENGGVLAFSTPNGRGISARKNIFDFLEKSPTDHFSILSPGGLSRILRQYGFQLKVVRVTGHHPERFPGILGRIAEKPGIMNGLLLAVSRLFGLGDTFEAYAVKIHHPKEDFVR